MPSESLVVERTKCTLAIFYAEKLLWALACAALLLLILTGVFGIGDWKLSGISLKSITSAILKCMLFLSGLYRLILIPGECLAKTKLIEEALSNYGDFLRSEKIELSNEEKRELGFPERFAKRMLACDIASAVICIFVVFIIYNPLIQLVGNLITDIIGIAIVLPGTGTLGAAAFLLISKDLRREDEQLYKELLSLIG